MQKKFLVGLLISIFGLINAAEMTIDVSEKIDISSDNIEVKNEEIGFKDNVIFQSKSYQIFGDVAVYNRKFELIKIEGSPIRFKINTEDNNFNGFSNLVIIQDSMIKISGSVFVEDKNSTIKAKVIKFNVSSGELQIN